MELKKIAEKIDSPYIESSDTRIAIITYHFKTKTFRCNIKIPYTTNEVKTILQKLIENNLEPIKP